MTEQVWEPRALTGLTFDEALEASVAGYRIRYAGMTEGAYIHYVFDGWRCQFADSFGRVGEGSSSRWNPYAFEQDQRRLWDIMPLASEQKRDAWGLPVTPKPEGFVDPYAKDAEQRLEVEMNKEVTLTGVTGFEQAQRIAARRNEPTWDQVNSDMIRTEGGWRSKDKWGR